MGNKIRTSKKSKQGYQGRLGYQVLMSYGPVWEIQQFLGPLESTKMQQINTYCYNIGVGRAQTRVALNCIITTGKNGHLKINYKHLMG